MYKPFVLQFDHFHVPNSDIYIHEDVVIDRTAKNLYEQFAEDIFNSKRILLKRHLNYFDPCENKSNSTLEFDVVPITSKDFRMPSTEAITLRSDYLRQIYSDTEYHFVMYKKPREHVKVMAAIGTLLIDNKHRFMFVDD